MNETLTTFTFNGKEYKFDVRDADHAEIFQCAVEKLRNTAKLQPNSEKAAETIRAQCKLIKDFFDNVFGDGAGSAICTERDNLGTCYDAYARFMALVRAQNEWVTQTSAHIPAKSKG